MTGNEELVELRVVRCEQTWLLSEAKTWARTRPGARNAGLWSLLTAEEKASCINKRSGLLATDLEGMLVLNPVTSRWEEETRIRTDLHRVRVFYTYFPSSTGSVFFSFHCHPGEDSSCFSPAGTGALHWWKASELMILFQIPISTSSSSSYATVTETHKQKYCLNVESNEEQKPCCHFSKTQNDSGIHHKTIRNLSKLLCCTLSVSLFQSSRVWLAA